MDRPPPETLTTSESNDARGVPQNHSGSLGAHLFTDTEFAGARGRAHDAMRTAGRAAPAGGMPVEMVIGIALIVIASLEILFIVRVVQGNMGRA